MQADFLSLPVKTIYFGGGTPSLLEADQLGKILEVINSIFGTNDPEITLEANPDDMTLTYLKEIRDVGINRLSIGVQSFIDTELKFMNRLHSAVQAKDALRFARDAGFSNLNLDLIYGIPGSSSENNQENLETALEFKPEHISMYCMTIETNTVFGNWHKKGKLIEEKEENTAYQYELISKKLVDAGYVHYEVSNFALPERESQHNSNYWKGVPYLGIGPSAHSYHGEFRQFNIKNNSRYIESIEKGIIPMEREYLTISQKINEYIMTSLRTIWGCDMKLLSEKFSINIFEENRVYIERLMKEGKARIENDCIILTLQGKLLADQITADLFVE